jgi:hypothetical protein
VPGGPPVTAIASSRSVPVTATWSVLPSPPGEPSAGSKLTSTSVTAVPVRSPSAMVSAPPKTTGSISSNAVDVHDHVADVAREAQRPPVRL